MSATLSARSEINRTRRVTAGADAAASPVGFLRRAYDKGRIGVALTCAVMALAAPTALQAATLVVNLRDVVSFGALGNPSNIVSFYDIGANSDVVAFAYNVNVFAQSPSWLSEATIGVTDSNNLDGFHFTPGFSQDAPGVRDYSGSADLTALGLDFRVGADGLLRLEYFEGFDDLASAGDAVLNGTLTFTYNPTSAVPELSTWAMMISGFGIAGVALRRRQHAGAQAGSLA